MLFGLFKKKQKDLGLPIDDKSTVPFDEVVSGLTKLSSKAQATFLFKLVNRLEKPLLKTLLYYTQGRLKYGNAKENKQLGDSTQRNSIWNKVENVKFLEHPPSLHK